MTGVKFVTVTELDKKATALVSEVERTEIQIVITKRGKPVALLQKVRKGDKGKQDSVSNLKNHSVALLTEIEKGGNQIIITRDNQPVAVLKRISNKAFTIEE